MSANTPGTVYLIHFSESIGHSRHYRGWTGMKDWEERIRCHQAGQGAMLTRIAVSRGITMTVARTWPGTPQRERQLKQQGGASRQCPLCTPMKRMYPGGYPGRRKES